MGKPVTGNVKRAEVQPLNTKINKKVFEDFKDYCAYRGYPMNVLVETFMQQYTNGRFYLEHEDIVRWKGDDTEVETLNTTFNKEIYSNFKITCKHNGYFVKHVITAFMKEITSKEFVMEYVNVSSLKGE